MALGVSVNTSLYKKAQIQTLFYNNYIVEVKRQLKEALQEATEPHFIETLKTIEQSFNA